MRAQDADVISKDSLTLSPDTVFNISDSVAEVVFPEVKDTVLTMVKKQQEFKPEPKKALIYAAVFPGLGQIYNRKYWKLPLVYGGFLGCAYAITWNNQQYQGYKLAYEKIQEIGADGLPINSEWKPYVPGSDDVNPAKIKQWTSSIKSKKDYYRRYRDLSCIIAVGVYALSIVDAYVDAQLFDFDISPDLGMRVEPVLFQPAANNKASVGLQCSFSF